MSPGSTISIQNDSAERKGERSLFKRSSISAIFASGSSAASISARYAASFRPQAAAIPNGLRAKRGACNSVRHSMGRAATPNALRIMTEHQGVVVCQMVHRLHAFFDRAVLLRLKADLETGAVRKIDNRKVERICGVDDFQLYGMCLPSSRRHKKTDRLPSRRPANRRTARSQ